MSLLRRTYPRRCRALPVLRSGVAAGLERRGDSMMLIGPLGEGLAPRRLSGRSVETVVAPGRITRFGLATKFPSRRRCQLLPTFQMLGATSGEAPLGSIDHSLDTVIEMAARLVHRSARW
jgi:hypothetical protein